MIAVDPFPEDRQTDFAGWMMMARASQKGSCDNPRREISGSQRRYLSATGISSAVPASRGPRTCGTSASTVGGRAKRSDGTILLVALGRTVSRRKTAR
jgi:hypothetical protein